MRSYIVRIYRDGKDNSRNIVGIVEEPEVEEKRAFTNAEELIEIINPRRRGRRELIKRRRAIGHE